MGLVTNFRHALQGMNGVLDRLIESYREQKNAFMTNDVLRIEQARLQQEQLLVELERAQAEYRRSARALAEGMRLDAGNPADLVGVRPDLADLARLWDRLLAGFAELKEITLTNRLLATRAVAFYRKVTSILQPDRQAKTYSYAGRLAEPAPPVISRVV